MDTTVCQGDDATFSCVVFIPSGAPGEPGWLRNSIAIFNSDMRHVTNSNYSDTIDPPVYFNSVITVPNVTPANDDGVRYQCGVRGVPSNNATLHVIGECIHVYVQKP